MKEICKENKCTGCSACYNICRHGAIRMLADDYGHIHPRIDKDKCIDCGLCQKICPVNRPLQLIYPQECYAAALKSDTDLMRCASGGAATAFAEYVISQGGVVYGCSGEDILDVHHIRISSLPEVEKLRGSKYVQSEIGYVYKSVMNDLRNNEKLVLFVGTPCQIAGLKAFLGKDYERLVTADLVCHGVPSQKMLNENISYYTPEKDGTKIKIAFRQKLVQGVTAKFNSSRIEYGWFFKTSHIPSIDKKFYKDSYMFGFLQCLTFRESCYTCRYATSARVSDITIADFWGLGNDAGFEKGKGVSVCLVNTEKGKSFFSNMEPLMHVVKRDVVEAIIGNGQLQCPSRKNVNYDKFRRLYPQLGLKKAIRQCLRKERFQYEIVIPFKQRIKRLIMISR